MSQQPPSMVDELLGQLQGAPMQQIAQQLGANSQQIQSAVSAALPMLLGALGNNAAQPQGATALLTALQRDFGNVLPQGLGSLGGLLGTMLNTNSNTPSSSGPDVLGHGAAILGHIFGARQQQVENSLGQATGLGHQAGQLLTMLAPIVMAFLANRVQTNRLDADSLGSSLQHERTQAQQQGGLAAGLLTGLLDQDGNGKLDAGDLLKFGVGLFNGRR